MEIWSLVGLQDPEICLSEVKAALNQLPVPRVRQYPVSALSGHGKDNGRERGGQRKRCVARRSTPTLVEAAHKTKSKPRSTTINMTEKLYKKLEGEGGKGDLPGYVPTEGYRWIQVMY